jgi:SAM-dependent methyltransferase
LEATGWSNGYATDREYVTEFYPELSPEHLNVACVLHGVEPVPLDRPFTYLELGCGYGLSSVLLAAANPNGRFHANDFMPAHVATAGQLLSEAGLDNLTMLEHSFEALARGEVDLPQFDFITMHGVYTWVSRENRRFIVDILSRYLKPGGIVYVSYNTLPGWAPALPLQRLLLSQASMLTGPSEQRIVQARDFVERLIGAGAKYFEANPGLQNELDVMRGADPAYLIHEYLHSGWEPMYHADVAADFQGAKLEFVGPSVLCSSWLKPSAASRPFLEAVPDPAWRETVGDFMVNKRFRKDIFVRGRRAMPASLRREWLQRNLLSLTVPRDRVPVCFGWPDALPGGDSPEAVLDLLAGAPQALSLLADRPLFDGRLETVLDNVATVMCDMGACAMSTPGRADLGNAAALRLNRVIASQSRQADRFKGLASPLTGNGIRANLLERLVYAELADRPDDTAPEAVAARVLVHLHAQGLSAAEDDAATATVAQVLATTVPLWRRLGMI